MSKYASIPLYLYRNSDKVLKFLEENLIVDNSNPVNISYIPHLQLDMTNRDEVNSIIDKLENLSNDKDVDTVLRIARDTLRHGYY